MEKENTTLRQESPATRKCRKCGQPKDLEKGFYKHPTSKAGREHVCKECKKDLAEGQRRNKAKAAKPTGKKAAKPSAAAPVPGQVNAAPAKDDASPTPPFDPLDNNITSISKDEYIDLLRLMVRNQQVELAQLRLRLQINGG